MICKNCPDHKDIDAVKQLDDAPSWVCIKKHSEAEDIICLLRMVIWQLQAVEDKINEKI